VYSSPGATGRQRGSDRSRDLLEDGLRRPSVTRNTAHLPRFRATALGASVVAATSTIRAHLVDGAVAAWTPLYLVSTPYERGGPEAEIRAGEQAGDAAKGMLRSNKKTLRLNSVAKVGTARPESRTSTRTCVTRAPSRSDGMPTQSSRQAHSSTMAH